MTNDAGGNFIEKRGTGAPHLVNISEIDFVNVQRAMLMHNPCIFSIATGRSLILEINMLEKRKWSSED